MKSTIILLVLAVCTLALLSSGYAQDKAPNKYVGVKACAPCHKSASSGNQAGIWEKSKHAEAYKTLLTPKANEIAKAKGLKTAAAESPECLECHTITADAKLVDKTFDVKNGVQCEVCHGPGSGYKSMGVMKDKAKAIAAGLVVYDDDAAIQKRCLTCHNDKSPTKKEFKFDEAWAKIKHAKPAKKS